MNKNANIANILSFDIEEWFQVANFQGYISENDWEQLESRVNIGVDFLLESLEKKNIKATFFLVGWVAEHQPEMVKKIQSKGHEIGIHGYMHKNITEQTPEEFRKDIEKSIKVVSGITQKPVRGYRAPTYTVTPKTDWALEILHDCGIEFDSSIYPIRNSTAYGYGYPNAPLFPFKFKNGLYEFPMSTFKFGNYAIPFGSGGYFRIFPYIMTHTLLKYHNNRDKNITINIHPWEMDPEQKVLENINLFHKFKHYTNLSRNRKKFCKLISDFKFCTFSDYINNNSFPEVELKNGTF